jgi:hypothetical protein
MRPMGTPMRPLPENVVRWGARARWIRRLDALVGWFVMWGLLACTRSDLGVGVQAVSAGLVVGLLGTIPSIHLRWRPISGPVGLWVSRRLAPGDRAWYVRPETPELVIVTACRGLHLTVAAPGRGGVEGLSVRRTRVLLLTADSGHR